MQRQPSRSVGLQVRMKITEEYGHGLHSVLLAYCCQGFKGFDEYQAAITT